MEYRLASLICIQKVMTDDIIKDGTLADIGVSNGHQMIDDVLKRLFKGLCEHGAPRESQCFVHGLDGDECFLNLGLPLINLQHLLFDQVACLETPQAGQALALLTSIVLYRCRTGCLGPLEVVLLEAYPKIIFATT